MGLIGSIIIGALCGWIGSKLMKSKGGLVRNIIIGLVGGLVGGWVFSLLPISLGSGIIGQLIGGVVGSCILIWIGKLLFK